MRVRRRTRTDTLHRPQRCIATAMAQLSQGSLARARSRRRSWQQQRFDGWLGAGGQGTAVEVQRPSGARAMGYSFIGSYQSASGSALPLCDPRPSGASGLKRASFYAFHWRGGDEVSSTSKAPLKGVLKLSLIHI